ncbi:MAG: hypothetical protein IKN38_08320 [Clostridia bacterium]|nr:hypothetical protein [Clostridia bacterium]
MDPEKKKKLKLFGSFLSLAVIAIAVILSAGFVFNKALGWFSTNKRVRGKDSVVRIKSESFELAVPLQSQKLTAFDTDEAIIDYLTTTGGYEFLEETSDPHSAIFCRLSNDTPGSTDREVKPGDYGTISFDLVPKDIDNIVVDFEFTMRGYYNNNNSIVELPENSDAFKLMQGHLLLFKTRTQITGKSAYYYSDRIEGDLLYDTAEHSADIVTVNGETHYRINLYWIWPETLSQMIFDSTNPKLTTLPMFDSAAERADLLDFILDNKDKIFYQYPGVDLDTDFQSLADADTNYLDLSDGYNNADQLIGESARYFVVEINANPVAAAADSETISAETTP